MAMMESEKEKRSPWLAISFGCCASSKRDSIDEDEGRVALRANGEAEMQICYDQPQSVSQPRADPFQNRPMTSHSMGRHVSQWVANSRDFATRASSRASMHTLTRPRKSHSRPRPSIGRPMDFRHCDGLDGNDGIQSMLDDAPLPVRRRRSFQPLELSIYLPEGRLSPLPDFLDDLWSEQPPELEIPAQALVRNRDSRANSIASNPSTIPWLIERKPVGSMSRRSSAQSQRSVQSRPLSPTFSTLPFLLEESKSRPESIVDTSSSLQRANTYGALSPNRILSRLPSPSRGRSNTAPARPGSVRRAKTDVDEAIRELNTIVEERRADAYRSANQSPTFINRPPPSPSSHVPAIAPSLRMHVRSETLSDIGSAFSAPLMTKPLPTPPPPPGSGNVSRQPTRLTLAPPKRTFSGPLDSNPITPPTPTIPTPTTPIGRLGAWLKRSLPTTPSSPSFLAKSAPTSKPSTPKSSKPQTPATAPPFYQCESTQYPFPANNSTPSSRPSTAGSKTLAHTRHTSNETATVTLLSSYPSTPSLSGTPRSLSPDNASIASSPATPARVNFLRGEGKTRRIPAPLTLAKEKEMQVEAALGSASSIASRSSARSSSSLRPPPSPNYGLLRGMEISAGVVERQKPKVMVGAGAGRRSVLPSPGAVGVAF